MKNNILIEKLSGELQRRERDLNQACQVAGLAQVGGMVSQISRTAGTKIWGQNNPGRCSQHDETSLASYGPDENGPRKSQLGLISGSHGGWRCANQKEQELLCLVSMFKSELCSSLSGDPDNYLMPRNLRFLIPPRPKKNKHKNRTLFLK